MDYWANSTWSRDLTVLIGFRMSGLDLGIIVAIVVNIVVTLAPLL